jgi:hypothetical protein
MPAVFLLLAQFTGPIPVAAQSSNGVDADLDSEMRAGRLDHSLVTAMRQQGSVDVLLVLDNNDIVVQAERGKAIRGVKKDDAPALAEKSAGYRARKQQVLSAAGGGATVLQDYEHFSVQHVRFTKLLALRDVLRRPDVRGIRENVPEKLMLTQSLPLIHQPEAVNDGFRGAGRSVAVLDTGLDYTRVAFGSCTAPGVPQTTCRVPFVQDFTPSDDGALDADVGMHGTNVAGIIAGVAPDAQVIGLDVFVCTGSGASQLCSSRASDQINALNWVVANQETYNIAAVNMSLGSSLSYNTTACSTDARAPVFGELRRAGVVPVVAAGNDASSNDTDANGGFTNGIAVPACVPGAVSVGAVYDRDNGPLGWGDPQMCRDANTAADQITCFSQSGTILSVLAPGALIDAAGIQKGGTSQAAPHVAGAFAALASRCTTATVDELEAAITGSGPSITDPRNNVTKHRLDLQAAGQTLAPSMKGCAVRTLPSASGADACRKNTLPRNDDSSTSSVPIGFPVNFFGQTYSNAFVNNNGNITFDSPMVTYTPFPLTTTNVRMIAPFFADVDTRPTGTHPVTYSFGNGNVGGRNAFCVDWVNVGYYNLHSDKLNSFQLILIDRSDVGAGNFDIEMNYDQILWETGDASGGSNGFGGSSARAGYSNGSTVSFEFPGSATSGGLLDSNSATGLINHSRNSFVPGRYVFPVRNGQAPVGGSITGTVYRSSETAGNEVEARVQVCSTVGFCNTTQTTAGIYRVTGLESGTYTVRAFPSGQFNPGSRGPFTLTTNANLTGQNIVVTGPQLASPGTTAPSTARRGSPWTLRTTGCTGATATYEIFAGTALLRTAALVEGPAGTYTTTVPGLSPSTTSVHVVITIPCPGGSPSTITFDVPYIDPSGFVRTTGGVPIAGATVTLFRSDSPTGPFDQVPNGDSIMALSNRINPDLSDSAGYFAWDVIAGYYVVRASKSGCTGPGGTAFVDSAVLSVPPAVTNLDLRLDCAARNTDAAAPMCAVSSVGTNAAGQRYIQVTVQDPGSGLATVLPTVFDNVNVAVSFSPGEVNPVIVTATRRDPTRGIRLQLQVTDVAGNVTVCDPVLVTIGIDSRPAKDDEDGNNDNGRVTYQTLSGIPQAEGKVTITNGSPGLRRLVVVVNGLKFQVNALRNGERRTVDIARAMRPGDNNTIVLKAYGAQGATADVLVWDGLEPAGTQLRGANPSGPPPHSKGKGR